MRQRVLVLHPNDNVATALVDLDVGQTVTAAHQAGTVTVRAQEPIAFGHKLALVPLAVGASVYKYGEVIGVGRGRHPGRRPTSTSTTSKVSAAAATSPPPHPLNSPSPRGRGDH